MVRVAQDIGGKLSFHDCTLLLTRRRRAPYLVGCVAQIVAKLHRLKKLRSGATANIWSHHEMKLEEVVREKLGVLFRRFVLFAQNLGDELWEYVRENLFRRFLLFAWDVRCNRGSHDNCEPRPKVEWPYVMNSSVAMQGPLISATWIWYHLLRHWHHGYYRARR